MNRMKENTDSEDQGFEDRIRELFEDGATKHSVSAKALIDGARRRRVRHRATMAGSSLAVLGVAVGAIAFGGHSAGPSRVATTSPALPKTCSASVTGTVPKTTPATIDGLDFETVSGTTMGIPWADQIHVFPNEQAHSGWMNEDPAGEYPPGAADVFHPGRIAQFRTPGIQGYTDLGEGGYFSFGPGRGLGVGMPVTSSVKPAIPHLKAYKAYQIGTWMDPKVDHLCLQYADSAEFIPVYRIQGGAFVEFGYVMADKPKEVIGYDAAGHVVGTTKAVMDPVTESINFMALNPPQG
jgi:hypothetical protein